MVNLGLSVAASVVLAPLLPLQPAAHAAPARQAYLDVSIGGEPAGRIVIELFTNDAPVGAQRFADLCEEKQGVGYWLSKFDGIYPTYIKNAGVKSLTYSATEASPIAGGDSLAALEAEMSASGRRHDGAGLVSLVVGEAEERPVTEKVVAIGGKFVTIKSQAGEAPNGTAFAITRGPAPELDGTNLVIGRVVEGLELIDTIGALPINPPRYDNAYFNLGKAIGDKRAITTEKGFYRPFKKVVVKSGGASS